MNATSTSTSLIVDRAVKAVHEHATTRDKALLLALLEYAPSAKGKANIARKILHYDEAVYTAEQDHRNHMGQLADLLWRNIILSVRVTSGRTPEPRSRISRSGISSAGHFHSPAETQAVNALKNVIELASQRDCYRCVISGKVDPEAVTYGPGALVERDAGLEVTRVTHIIPFSLRDTPSTSSAGHLPSIMDALECFSGTSLNALMHGGINALDNVITLSATLYRYFTELQVALEPIADMPHTYTVRTWGKIAPRLGLPATVKLSSASGAPLPNPAYLALHCAICRVLWSSARAVELKELLEDLEAVTLLAPDGSSANLINIAIYRSLALTEA